ncbi:MAG: magnesium transporter [Alphaproteobacteria bacterium]|nr:magnesium transporter [Alphaproteobacteria bacterium]
MTDASDIAAREDGQEPAAMSEELTLTPQFVRAVLDALEDGKAEEVKRLVAPLHAADIADLLGLLAPAQRRALVDMLKDDLDPEVLSELDEGVRDEILPYLEPAVVARAVEALDSDDAVYLIQDLEADQQRAILSQLSDPERAAVERALQYPEYSAGRLMQREIITVPPFWTVGRVIDHLRIAVDVPDDFYAIYVVDPTFHPIGAVALSRIMRTQRPVPIEEIMDREPVVIPARMEQEEAAYLFDQYHLISAPVVDDDGRLVGMITVDDIVGVIQEEHEEDIFALAGVGDEELSDPVLTTTRRRFWWLFANLLTAILASAVIAVFARTIDQIVALAVLMPIVASMGGNAGTQTLAIAVRALATRNLTAANAARIIFRETVVGGINGIVFAVIMGLVAGLWFSSATLGVVIAVAMIVNLLVAGAAGILIPLALDRYGADPAISSSVFLTTVTDVVGFFVFLGLATLMLLG